MTSPRRSPKQTPAPETSLAVAAPPAQTLEAKALASQERHRHLEALHSHFRHTDLPAFEMWLDTEFGEERTTATALRDRANELERILFDAEAAWMAGEAGSLQEAVAAEWAAAQARANNPDDDSFASTGGMPPDEFDMLFESYLSDVRGIDIDEMDDAKYEKARADFAEAMGRAAAGDKAGFEKLMLRTAADESADNVRAVKTIYRRLAKKLHPDQSGSWDETEKRLWDEAAAAYEGLNLEDLKRIELMLCLHRGEEIPATRKGELRTWMQRLLKAISGLEKDLREMRQHPAWGFAKRRRTKAFREKIRKELDADIRQDQARIAMMEQELAILLRRRVKRKAPSRRKKPRSAQ